MVSATIPSDSSVLSRTPALNVAAQPTASAGLFGDSPASTPPAPPSTIRLPTVSHGMRSESIQAIQARADTASVIAIATCRGSPMPGRGLDRVTVMSTTTRPQLRTRSVTRVTLTARAPVTGSVRVAKPNTPFAPGLTFRPDTAGITVARRGRVAPGRAG